MNKTVTLTLLGLLVGCSSAPTKRDLEMQVAKSFAESLQKPMLSMRIASENSAPLPATTYSDRSISVTISGHLGAVQCRDKTWMIQVGPNTRVVSYTSSQGSAGAALNIRGFNGADIVGMQLPANKQVYATDALVVVSQSPAGSFSTVDEAMGVVFVPFEVVGQPPMFHGPLIGDGFLPRFFRNAPILESQMDMDRCPSVINFASIYQPGGPVNPSAWGAAPPSIEVLLSEMGRFNGDYIDGWPVASYAPLTQHMGYGTFYAGQVSTALCVMCSTLPLEQRRLLAYAIVQRGLDQIGSICDGRVLYPLGGHCAGRKALIIVAGHLLKVEAFCHPSAFFPNTLQEDRGYFIKQPSAWWFGAGWTAGWAFNTSPGFNGDQLINHPSTWGDPNSPTHSTFGWCFRYITQVVPAQVGTALVMKLMNRESEMGPMCQMVRQWMGPIPEAAATTLNQIYGTIPWGDDYAVPFDFCATAYKLYGFNQ